MTNSQTAQIIERFINGEKIVDIRAAEGRGHFEVNSAIQKYFYQPTLMPVEFLYDSKMNDETVETFVVAN